MKFDCVIVLANEMDKAGNLNIESQARIELGCAYYFNNSSAYIITPGWNYRSDSKLFIGEVMKEYALKLGVMANNVISELNSRDTVGDAFFTRLNIIKKNNWRNLLVATSDYHVRRSAAIFQFIYGPDYKVKIIGAPGFSTPEKLASEKLSLEAFQRTFENINPGDENMIFNRLSSKHPFYNGDIYKRIDLNFSE